MAKALSVAHLFPPPQTPQWVLQIFSDPQSDSLVVSHANVLSVVGSLVIGSSEVDPHSGEAMPTTALLQLLENTNVSVIAGIIALKNQIATLKESCFVAFVRVAQHFLSRGLSMGLMDNLFSEVCDVSSTLTSCACATGKARQVALLLRNLADKMAMGGCLVPIHADFLQACISGQLYGTALTFLKSNKTLVIDCQARPLTLQDVFRFYYYSGVCYISEKNFSQALHNFNVIISAPAPALSLVVVSAIKKAQLISLIETGHKYACPKTTCAGIGSFLSQNTEYSNIAVAFETDLLALTKALADGKQTLTADGNYGLAKQRIARELNLEHNLELADQCLYRAINQNAIQAQCNGETLMVTFGVQPQENSLASAKKQLLAMQLNGSLVEMIQLSDHLREKHKSLLSSQRFLRKATSSGRSSSWQGTSIASMDDHP